MGIRNQIMSIAIKGLAIYLLVLLLLPISDTLAKPTTAEQAQRVVMNWLSMDGRPMGAILGQEVTEVETYSNKSANALYYVVYLEPAGFVIVPADDLVEPIIGFLPEGRYDPSPDNPLGALVSQDVPGRVIKVREMEQQARAQGLKFPTAGLFQAAQRKWDLLAGPTRPTIEDFGIPSVSDVRVSPLVQSKWSQSTECGNYCYNYYTPNYYVCGCVATAQAQLMRYHTYPTTGPGTPSFTIYVDGTPQSRSLRGGDGFGGAYSWSSMVPDPDCSTTTAQRQAIGALTHDAGVSVNMSYSSAESGSDTLKTADSLVNTFGYSNAKKGYNSGNNLLSTNRNKMVNPNLDAGFPVLLGITSSSVGHAIVTDGYGYNVLTLYHHLNMGWAGSSDAWYDLPNIDSSTSFTSVYKCVYNVYTSGSGEIISGRVVDSGGNPLSGATVTATRTGGGTYTATTNSNGIYALSKIPSSSTYTIEVSKTGYAFDSQVVSTGTSTNYSTTTGNLWEIDFTAVSGMNVTPSIGLSSEGNSGGPFSPASIVYTLENQTDTGINYSVSKGASWVSISDTGGSLAGHATTDVTVSINSNANSLSNGTYTDTIYFTNTTDHDGDTTRGVTLTVGAPTLQYSWNMDSNPGWTTEGLWAWGQPTGGGGTVRRSGPDQRVHRQQCLRL